MNQGKLSAEVFPRHSIVWITGYCYPNLTGMAFGVWSVPGYLQCSTGLCFTTILFLIYINDLVHDTNTGDLTLFTDDTSILWRSRETGQLNAIIEIDLKNIKELFDSNRLSLNPNRTHNVGFKCDVKGVSMDGDHVSEKKRI